MNIGQEYTDVRYTIVGNFDIGLNFVLKKSWGKKIKNTWETTIIHKQRTNHLAKKWTKHMTGNAAGEYNG